MNGAILNVLNIIRIKEQRKLLFKIQEQLDEVKSDDQSLILDLTRQLVRLTRENQHDTNYNTALANYKKLSSALLLYTRKSNRLNSNLLTINKSLAIFEEATKENLNNPLAKPTGSDPSKNANESLLANLETVIPKIKDDLEEIKLKNKSFIPEQLKLKPLSPFSFINQNKELTEGMVSIFVLNENGADHLKNLFESFLRTNTYPNYKFFIIDRGSSDHSPEIISKYKDQLKLQFIPYEQKFTNSYLYNLAVDSCHSEFLLFLNNKVIFKDDVLPVYLDLFNKDKSCGIIGASIINSSSEAQAGVAEYYGSIRFVIEDIEGQVDIPFPLIDPTFLFKSGIETSFRDYRQKECVYIPPGTWLTCLKPVAVNNSHLTGNEIVPAVSGSALMCKKVDFIKAGGFSLNYHNGYEDLDLCLKFGTRLNKKSVLAHQIELQLNTENILGELGLADEFGSNYNLGNFLNENGYFIKTKYLDDIINKNQFWTSESNENLAACKRFVDSLDSEPLTDPNNDEDSPLADQIISAYLDGFKDGKLRIVIKIPAFNDDRAQFWGDYHFAHALKKAFIKKGHPTRVDLFEAWHEYGGLTDDVVIVLRGIKKYHTRGSQINIMWNISHPVNIEESEYRDYDYVFVASNFFADELKAKFNIQAENLLQCTDPDLFYPDTTEVSDEEKTDILFVANSRGVMRKVIEFTMKKDIPVTIYGTSWEKFLPPEMIKGNYIKNEELRKYYSNCNILLNDHWEDMVSSGFISNRLFDAIACGTIVLTDPVNGIEDTFSEGIYIYRDADDLAAQVDWIRDHFVKAKYLASKNITNVIENHTFDKRAERILEVVMQIHRQKTIITSPIEVKPKKSFRRMFDFLRRKPLL